jgi:hypothetical protein
MALPTTEHELALWLEEVIFDATCGTEDGGIRIRSFEEAGLLTANEGLVLRLSDGAEFQVTIVRSR